MIIRLPSELTTIIHVRTTKTLAGQLAKLAKELNGQKETILGASLLSFYRLSDQEQREMLKEYQKYKCYLLEDHLDDC